jgi:hypothetical protein
VNLIQKSKTKHLLMKKTKFSLEYVVNHDTKEVWVICDSAITAMGIPAMVKEFYPGYTGKIASREYFETLKNELVKFKIK